LLTIRSVLVLISETVLEMVLATVRGTALQPN
jgi:hypothetical protein